MKLAIWISVSVLAGLAVCIGGAFLAYRYASGPAPTDPVLPAASTPIAKATEKKLKLIEFANMQFEEPIAKERLAKFIVATNATAGKDWQHIPWHWREAASSPPDMLYIFEAQWCSRRSNKHYCNCSSSSAPCHLIDLVASPRRIQPGEPRALNRFSMFAHDYPPGDGWGVWLHYGENWIDGKQLQEHFQVLLFRMPINKNNPPEPALVLPWDQIDLMNRSGPGEYAMSVSVKPRHVPHFMAREYLSSAEALRQKVLADQETLLSLAKKQIEAGDVERVTDYDNLALERIEKSPPHRRPVRTKVYERPIPNQHSLTQAQKQDMEKQVVTELERRRQIIRDEGDEIFAALERAFPLRKVLEELDKEGPRPAK